MMRTRREQRDGARDGNISVQKNWEENLTFCLETLHGMLRQIDTHITDC